MSIKRVTTPEGMVAPDGYVYVGKGSRELECRNSAPFFGRHSESCELVPGLVGGGGGNDYFLPADSPLLEPLTHTVNLPAGLPPVPEEGLEAMGWGVGMNADQHNGYFTAEIGKHGWEYYRPGMVRTDGYNPSRFILRRPPVKPLTQVVPFDSGADFGDVFPVWVHAEDDGAGAVTWIGGDEMIWGCGKNSSKFSELAHLRWSTSPLTKWSDCKPFTKTIEA